MAYTQHFGLRDAPFAASTMRHSLLALDANERLRRSIGRSLARAGAIYLLAGDSAATRTALLQALAEDRDGESRRIVLDAAGMGFEDLVHEAARLLDFRAPGKSGTDQAALLAFIMAECAAIRPPLILLNNADCAADDLFRGLARIFPASGPRERMPRVVLAGGDAFPARFEAAAPGDLLARRAETYTIGPLSIVEAEEFIDNCLEQVGHSSEGLFEPQAIVRLTEIGEGRPEAIARHAERGLIAASERGAPRVGAEHIVPEQVAVPLPPATSPAPKAEAAPAAIRPAAGDFHRPEDRPGLPPRKQPLPAKRRRGLLLAATILPPLVVAGLVLAVLTRSGWDIDRVAGLFQGSGSTAVNPSSAQPAADQAPAPAEADPMPVGTGLDVPMPDPEEVLRLRAETLEGAIDDLTANLGVVIGERDGLSVRLRTVKETEQALRSDLEAARQRIRDQAVAFGTTQRQLAEARSRLAEMESRLASVEAARGSAAELATGAESDARAAARSLAEAKAANDTLRAEIGTLRDDLDRLKTVADTVPGLKRDLARQKTLYEQADGKIARLEQQLATVTAERNRIMAAVADRPAAAVETPAAEQQIASPADPKKTELSPEVDTLLARAATLAENQQLTVPPGNNAVESYKAVLEQAPDNETALAALDRLKSDFLLWGRSAMARGEYDAALRQYRKALFVDPRNDEALEALNKAREKAGVAGATVTASADPTGLARPETGRAMTAAGSGDLSTLGAWLATGGDVNQRDGRGWTLLMHAAAEGQTETVDWLLDRGAELGRRDADGRTPLLRAVWDGRSSVVALLLEAGADVNARDGEGRTPLQVAAARGYEAMLGQLVAAGANLNSRDQDGQSPLIAAAVNGHVSAVATLIRAGADVNAADENGRTALLQAIARRQEPAARLLLQAGAEIDHADSTGETALMAAATMGEAALAEELLRRGADPTRVNAGGASAADIALRHGRITLAQRIARATN
ncbi:ankyrin repeat domain-containing protein [Oceanibacterium hippocampi]|uniref:Phosphocholine transferase AnkX n=1 Tax=Oceanibacterium hippocampi TaxID=745714 RepID=A0A1Y5RUP7_9PROT|nr:ankyrin repeat domain-containing protein [Oceanibacterium hippocampi]SLN25803.1 Phosphocholine transferase AnkX [Oceanibacterium hippocampi]